MFTVSDNKHVHFLILFLIINCQLKFSSEPKYSTTFTQTSLIIPRMLILHLATYKKNTHYVRFATLYTDPGLKKKRRRNIKDKFIQKLKTIHLSFLLYSLLVLFFLIILFALVVFSQR